MNDSKISVRYAKALFESALEKNILEKVKEDMEDVQRVAELAEFQHLLVNPVVRESDKIRLFEEVFGKRIQALTHSLLVLVIQNGREVFIPGIARNYIRQYMNHKGIRSAVFTSATPMGDELKDRVGKVIGEALKSPVDLVTGADEDLIGGFVLRIEDMQYDASVAASLKKVKKQLLK